MQNTNKINIGVDCVRVVRYIFSGEKIKTNEGKWITIYRSINQNIDVVNWCRKEKNEKAIKSNIGKAINHLVNMNLLTSSKPYELDTNKHKWLEMPIVKLIVMNPEFETILITIFNKEDMNFLEWLEEVKKIGVILKRKIDREDFKKLIKQIGKDLNKFTNKDAEIFAEWLTKRAEE